MTNNEKMINTLIRDVTRVGSIPKSECRRRIKEIQAETIKSVLPDKENKERFFLPERIFMEGYDYCRQQVIDRAKKLNIIIN